MTKPGIELKVPSAGKNPKTLENAANWKSFASPSGDGYFTLQTKDIGDVPVRLFLTESLLSSAEDKCMVHRKGATHAFPVGHPFLKGTAWEDSGHPVLITGSNKDYSYILRPLAGRS